MKVFQRYFQQNQIRWTSTFLNQPDAIVIIPVLNDPDVFDTIDSLRQCSCEEGNVGVIIVLNHSEGATELEKQTNCKLASDLQLYIDEKKTVGVCFEIMEAFDLPAKYAGVGFARKLAMDAAALFFYEQKKFESPILSLDADTLVEKNYFDVVLDFFRKTVVAGVSIAYAHRLTECDASSLDAIIKYELYLRYYQLALEYTGHPHAFHCIGSAFAVRTLDYVAQGGMNKRQAGEDFYFLQKLISTGRYAYLKETSVYPSARFSTRTPFGTGRSLRQIMDAKGEFLVYNFDAFRELKLFFFNIDHLYKTDGTNVTDYFAKQSTGVQSFLLEIRGEEILAEINANCASIPQFKKRFFDYFNAFRVLKYLNYVHEKHYSKEDVFVSVAVLFRKKDYLLTTDWQENLQLLRNL